MVALLAAMLLQITASPPAPVTIPRVSTAPAVDGVLSDSVWRHAVLIADFKQRLPVEGAEPTERTEVYLLHTGGALYVGARAHDRQPQRLAATVMRRDDPGIVSNDQFAIAIDSYNDNRNGYWFSTNPLGVRVDAQFFDEGRLWEVNWDGAWVSKARVDSGGWVVELAIPFSTLRFPEAAENVMGINFFRRLVRSNEGLFAPLIPLRYLYGTPNVSVARKYMLEGIRPGVRFTVQPYVLGSRAEAATTGAPSTADRLDAGVDVSYQPIGNITINGSYNTDFAQAEADTRQINLSRFSLFFPEKRDFFLERAGTFSFGIPAEIDLFFSRRVGLATDSTGITRSVPIKLGARATGTTGKLEFGLLDVQTSSSGVAPSENFGVARVKLGLGQRAYIGAIATNRGGTVTRASAWGLDYSRYFSEDFGISAFVANLADGTNRSFGSRSAGTVTIFKSGERTSFEGSVTGVGSAFAPSIGFVSRRGIWKWVGRLSVPVYFATSRWRRVIPEFNVEYFDGQNGPLESSVHTISVGLETKSDDRFGLLLSRSYEFLKDTFAIFTNVIVPPGVFTTINGTFAFGTKPGRRAAFQGSVTAGGFWNGRRVGAALDASWKVNRHLTVGHFHRSDVVRLSTGRFTASVWGSRMSYSLNTALSAEGLAQYDNKTRTLGTQLRMRYIVAEGTEVLLVTNQQFEDEPLQRSGLPKLASSAFVVKGTYGLHF